MKKKATSKTETLLFVLGISFAVFILLFVIIFTVITIVKKYRKDGTLLSLLRPDPDEDEGTEANNPPSSETWQANSDTSQKTKRMPAKSELH
ncbi:hypothetical protein ACFPPD_08820 [Cohnella suwonensis]|uniref:Uncharacterized protein n=1 Tax=Cohnella suwonensis TaxID=696072 RepID=A0ABW0LSE2_9BACL